MTNIVPASTSEILKPTLVGYCKTKEDGKPVDEDCYVANVAPQLA